MSTIVYAWELGDNYGHMASFSGIAEALEKKGHNVIAVLQNLSEASKFFQRTNIRYLQAPVWRKKESTRPRAALTYADLIRGLGYSDSEGLATLIKAWRELLALLSPDMVIFDSAPTALLAARGMPCKTVAYGSGYAIPPATAPLPDLRRWMKTPPAEILRRESATIEVINTAAAHVGIAPIQHLHNIFDTNATCLLTFPELDHYEERGKAEYFGPRFLLDKGTAPKWPHVSGKRIFAYLRPDSPHFLKLLEQLRHYPASIIVAAPGMEETLQRKYQAPHIYFSMEPLNLAAVRKESDAVICHAGQGTVAAFLLAGIPLVLFPNHLEQLLVAKRAVSLGAAVMPDPGVKDIPYKNLIDTVLATPTFKEKAQAFSSKYSQFDQDAQTQAIIKRLEAILPG